MHQQGRILYPSKIKYHTQNLEFTNRASLIGFNRRPNINLFNNKYSGILNYLSRFESGLTPSDKYYRPNTIALEHINKGNPITSQVINSVLLNQKVSITQQELDELLSLPKVIFDLPLTNHTYPALSGLIGKPGSRRSKAGIYVFSHKYSDKKYVGSSNDLARRFKQYFEKNALFSSKDTGILLPMLEKENFKAFTLEVTVIPSSFSNYAHCFLEQYFLLDKSFNLNIHKIVNFRVNQGFKIYLYDMGCKTLYYSSNSLNAFCADLGIHHSSYKKHVANNEPYLDYFIISNSLITDAVPTNLTEIQIREFINKQRKDSLNKLHKSYGSVVEVFDTYTNTIITIDSVAKAASKFGVSRSTIRSYISSEKPYKSRYKFKFISL
jgi:GIY-YIG catalytic domain/NUMOD1 domain